MLFTEKTTIWLEVV